MKKSNYLFILILCIQKQLIFSAPRLQAGPCIGMDCLHGILMHDDKEIGKDHATEHHLQKVADEAPATFQNPCHGMDCMHGVLMHNDENVGQDHSEEDKQNYASSQEENNQKNMEPCFGMDCMHGVLMHGDTERGKTHHHKDSNDDIVTELINGLKELTSGTDEKKDDTDNGPCVGMDCLHSLMHNDWKDGKDHHETAITNENESPEKYPTIIGIEFVIRNGNYGKLLGVKSVEKLKEMETEMREPLDNEDVTTEKEETKFADHKKNKIEEPNQSGENRKNIDENEYSYSMVSDTPNTADLMKKRYMKMYQKMKEMKGDEQDKRLKWKSIVTDLRSDLGLVGNSGPVQYDDSHSHSKK